MTDKPTPMTKRQAVEEVLKTEGYASLRVWIARQEGDSRSYQWMAHRLSDLAGFKIPKSSVWYWAQQ